MRVVARNHNGLGATCACLERSRSGVSALEFCSAPPGGYTGEPGLVPVHQACPCTEHIGCPSIPWPFDFNAGRLCTNICRLCKVEARLLERAWRGKRDRLWVQEVPRGPHFERARSPTPLQSIAQEAAPAIAASLDLSCSYPDRKVSRYFL